MRRSALRGELTDRGESLGKDEAGRDGRKAVDATNVTAGIAADTA